jgi:hypothetical protein
MQRLQPHADSAKEQQALHLPMSIAAVLQAELPKRNMMLNKKSAVKVTRNPFADHQAVSGGHHRIQHRHHKVRHRPLCHLAVEALLPVHLLRAYQDDDNDNSTTI